MLKAFGYHYSKAFLYLTIFLLLTSCASSKKARKYRKEKVDLIVQTARSFIGTPYRWGGTNRAGMDCSGLLYNAFLTVGVEIPRVSKDQGRIGKKVSLYDLQPGDLVFFAAKKGSRKVTHVGLVTEIKGRHNVQFIHSSTKLGVVENNIYSDYYRKIYVKARRPF